ncbi:MAG: lipopolysaccharide biosynthesis protein [Methanosarcina sp.]
MCSKVRKVKSIVNLDAEYVKTIYMNTLKDPLYINSYFSMVNTVTTAILGFIFWSIASRMYSTQDIGLTVIMISAISLFTVFTNLGFSSSLIRYLPLSNEKTYITTVNTCFTVSSLVSLLLSLFYLIGIDYFSPDLAFIRENWFFSLSFILFSVVMSLNTLQFSVFVGKRSVKFEFIKNLVWNILKIILLFIFVWLGAFGVFASFGISLVISFLFSTLFFLPKIYPKYTLKFTIDRKVIKDLKHFSAKNFVTDIFTTAPGYILPILITNSSNPENGAYFYMAWMITGFVMMVPIAISNSFFAEGSYNEESVYTNFKKSLFFSFTLLIPMIILVLLIGDKILLILGENYTNNAKNTLYILVLSCLPYTFNRMYTTLKKIEKSMDIVMFVNAITTIIGLASGYFLINSMGLVGIAVGWMLGQSIVTVGIICRISIELIKKSYSNQR